MANHDSRKRAAGRKPVGKRALSLLMALVMSLSLVQITAFAVEEITNYRVVERGTEVSDNAGLVTIKKTATHKTDDQFDINLSVTVKKTEETTVTNNPAHIVLVMDRSNSMEENSGRFANARKAAKTFVSALLKGNDTENDNGNRIAVVGFGTKADTGTAFSNDVEKLNGWIESATKAYENNNDGGTNIQAGIHEAQRLLKNDDFTGKKIIVVFSDGMPTYSYRYANTAEVTKCHIEWFPPYEHVVDKYELTGTWHFDYNDRVGSGSAYGYRDDFWNNDYPYVRCTCKNHRREKTDYITVKDILKTNGDATIAEAKIAKENGTEIYSVYLGGSDEQQNKNALETMKGIVSDAEKNFLSTNKMEDLAKLFGQIAQTITTETSGLTVSDPMGDFITLGDVQALVDAGVITLAEDGRSFTWNVSQSEATINQDGSKTYTLIYPVTLNAAAPEFESGTPYPTNGTTTLTYYVTGDTTARTLNFDVPTVTATKATTPEPPVVTETSYTVKHQYYINNVRVDNGEVTTTGPGNVGGTVKLSATKDLEFEYDGKNYAYGTYTVSPEELELVGDASKNVIVVSYYLTEEPETKMSCYPVVYRYFTNGVEDENLGDTQAVSAEAGKTIVATDVPLREMEGYTLVSITTNEEDIFDNAFAEFAVNETATANPTVYVVYTRETTPEKEPSGYSVHHSYYTNDKFDGESYEWVSEGLYVGDVINATNVKTDYPTTFKDNEYKLTGIDGLPLTLSEIITENVIEVRYDRTVEVEPEVRYTVLHEYYVKGADTAEARLVESFVAEPNQEVTLESIAQVTQPSKLNDYTYEYVGGSPETLTVTADGENTFVLRYERTVEINPDPIPTTYTVKHEYYTNGVRDDKGEVVDEKIAGEVGDEIGVTSCDWKQTYGGNSYGIPAATPISIVLVADEALNVITLRYDRTTSTPVNPPVGPTVTYYTVTVNYYDKASGETIHTPYTDSKASGSSYDVTAQDKIAIEGYTYVETSGDALTGTLNGNKVINVYYSKTTDIDDGDTPTTPAEPGSDIGDDDVPTTPAQPPKTGDSMGLWIAAALVSGMGLVWLALSGKKREERA